MVFFSRCIKDILPEVSAAELQYGTEGYLNIFPEGKISLPPASCLNGKISELPIQGVAHIPQKKETGLLTSVEYPAMMIASLRNCVCLPGGVILQGSNGLLMDSFDTPWDARHKYLEGGHEQGWSLKQDHEYQDIISDPILFFDSQNIDHFGHFYLDSMTRGWSIPYLKFYFGMKNLKILISGRVSAYVTVLLNALGVESSDIICPNKPVLCHNLIIATKSLQIQDYVSPSALLVWNRVRDISSQYYSANFPERIYVSRHNIDSRRLKEEDVVEAIFIERGFFVIYPEEMPIEIQIALFSNAKMIAGCSGSNMFNLAFQKNCHACLILVSPMMVHYTEHFLHYGHKGSLTYFLGYVSDADRDFNPYNIFSPWHVDIKLLEECVDRWIQENG